MRYAAGAGASVTDTLPARAPTAGMARYVLFHTLLCEVLLLDTSVSAESFYGIISHSFTPSISQLRLLVWTRNPESTRT